MNGPREELQDWLLRTEQFRGSADAASWRPSGLGWDGQSLLTTTADAVGTVPDNYEPRYAYPLIVWLCDDDCGSAQAMSHISSMSPQNYVGLALEGAVLPERRQADDARDVLVDTLKHLVEIENRIVAAVRDFRQTVHVHSERVFLVGARRAASTALLVAMHQPEWFSGCVTFGGNYPTEAGLFVRRRRLTGPRFWLSAPQLDRVSNYGEGTLQAARQLIAAGADVTTHLHTSNRLICRSTLLELDRWIISGILAEAS